MMSWRDMAACDDDECTPWCALSDTMVLFICTYIYRNLVQLTSITSRDLLIVQAGIARPRLTSHVSRLTIGSARDRDYPAVIPDPE